jgi:transcriptional regulator with XRE-family HTH domain
MKDFNIPDKERLADAVRRLQYVKGVTNVQLAQMMGVTTMTVGNIRNGIAAYETMVEAFRKLEKYKVK